MASSDQPKGRGRGRGRAFTQQTQSGADLVPAPARTTTADVEPKPSTSADVEPKPSTSADVEPKPPTTTAGRGRGRRNTRKADVEVPSLFQADTRAAKPQTTGTSGKQITVRTNYFLISAFPQKGIVRQYDIEIKNKRDQLVARDHRR